MMMMMVVVMMEYTRPVQKPKMEILKLKVYTWGVYRFERKFAKHVIIQLEAINLSFDCKANSLLRKT